MIDVFFLLVSLDFSFALGMLEDLQVLIVFFFVQLLLQHLLHFVDLSLFLGKLSVFFLQVILGLKGVILLFLELKNKTINYLVVLLIYLLLDLHSLWISLILIFL